MTKSEIIPKRQGWQNLNYSNLLCFGIVMTLILFTGSRFTCAQQPGNREQEQFDFANGLFERGLYDMAINEYKKYSENFKEGLYTAEAGFGIAESLFFKEDYKLAIPAYQHFLGVFPTAEKVPIATLRLGQSFFFDAQYDPAITAFQSLTRDKLNPQMAQTLDYYRGRAFYHKGDKTLASENLLSATQIKDQERYTAHSFLLLGDIAFQEEKYEEAKGNYVMAYDHAQDEPVKSLALYKKGEAEFKSAKYEEAIETFRACLGQYSHLPLADDAFVNLLTAYFNHRRYEEILKEFEQYQTRVEKQKGSFRVYSLAAAALMKKDEFEKAVAVLEEGLKLESLTPDEKTRAILKKAECLIKAKQMKEANDLIRAQLSDAAAYQDRVLFLEAESLYGLGRFDQALVVYQKIIADFPASPLADEVKWAIAVTYNKAGDSASALTAFIEYFKNGLDGSIRTDALYNAILIETKLEKTDAAIGHAKEYLSAHKTGSHYERVFYLLGNLYQQAGQHEQAIDVFQDYITERASSERLMEVYFLLGYELQLTGQPDQALDVYNLVLKNSQNNNFYYPALKNSAAIHLASQQNEKAVEIIQRIVTEFQENDLPAASLMWLAEHYINHRQYREAGPVLDKIKVSGDDSQQNAGVSYLRAEVSYGMKDYAKAIERYTLSLSQDKNGDYRARAQLGKALSLKDSQRYPEAAKELEKIIEDNPEDQPILMRARFSLAQAQELDGQNEAAVKMYMLVAVLHEDEYFGPQALFKAGQIFEAQGKTREAQGAYQELMNKYKQSEFFEQAAGRIQLIRGK